MDFVRSLLSPDGFMPHGHCYLWRPGLVMLHALSDGVIALAYISIPAAIVRFVRGRRDLPYQWMFLAFGAFVVSCGVTHALEIWTLWHASYWLSGAAKAVTAIVSAGTAVLLIRTVPLALALPSPSDLRRAQEELRRANAELQRHLESSTLEARQSAAYLQALLDGTTDAIFVKDLSGRYQLANQATATGLRRPLAEVLGRTDLELLDEPLARGVTQNDARVRQSGETLTAEEPGPQPGQVFLSTKGVVRDAEGRVMGTFGVSRDITERKREEQALRLQKETLQAIVDNIPEMVVFLDASGRPLLVNRDFVRILGWTAEDAREVDLFAELYPDPAARGRAAEFIGASEGRWGEFRTRTRAGDFIDTEWVNVRLSDGTVIGVGRDVTERKRLEDQFRHAQKMEAVGRLAGGVAHDFNNLLGVITGYAELARRALDAGHPAATRLDEVLKAADRAAMLTRQLLAFSRRQVLEPRLVDVNEALLDLEKMLHRVIGEDVTLVMHLAPGLGAVRADPGQLAQVVMNLVTNARDAMPRGGTISVETTEAEAPELRGVVHGPVNEGRYLCLAIADTGEGMDEATRARAFEPFYTTKPLGVGTGLGLSTVYGIVNQSGGHVVVESAPGRGTTFRVYLPFADAWPQPPPTEPETAVEGSETILVVEDLQSLGEAIRESLGAMGYEVLLAADPRDALELAREHAGVIHLLLTDVVMPGMSGPELAAQVQPLHPGIRVLFMSGYTADVLGRQGAMNRGIEIIDKPFTGAALARKMRRVLASEGGAKGGPA
jgi:PAS domain S-box-containing protein